MLDPYGQTECSLNQCLLACADRERGNAAAEEFSTRENELVGIHRARCTVHRNMNTLRSTIACITPMNNSGHDLDTDSAHSAHERVVETPSRNRRRSAEHLEDGHADA